jgi:hypothetical protein
VKALTRVIVVIVVPPYPNFKAIFCPFLSVSKSKNGLSALHPYQRQGWRRKLRGERELGREGKKGKGGCKIAQKPEALFPENIYVTQLLSSYSQ